MARMSIYLPDELQRRLARLQDQVSWSQVAQKAFEGVLRLNPEWSEDQMSAVVERLRASKIKEVDEVIARGAAAGREWAEQKASYRALKTVAEKVLLPSDPDDIPDNAITEWVGETHVDFFAPYIGDNEFHVGPYFQIGFLQGAKAVWAEVRSKI
jgi:hypothetical protein